MEWLYGCRLSMRCKFGDDARDNEDLYVHGGIIRRTTSKCHHRCNFNTSPIQPTHQLTASDCRMRTSRISVVAYAVCRLSLVWLAPRGLELRPLSMRMQVRVLLVFHRRQSSNKMETTICGCSSCIGMMDSIRLAYCVLCEAKDSQCRQSCILFHEWMG